MRVRTTGASTYPDYFKEILYSLVWTTSLQTASDREKVELSPRTMLMQITDFRVYGPCQYYSSAGHKGLSWWWMHRTLVQMDDGWFFQNIIIWGWCRQAELITLCSLLICKPPAQNICLFQMEMPCGTRYYLTSLQHSYWIAPSVL